MIFIYYIIDVQELSQNSVGDLNLHEHRQKIQQLAEDTNTQLKKNVYINYMQFIETAKEISCKNFIRSKVVCCFFLLKVILSNYAKNLGTLILRFVIIFIT